MHTLQQYAAMVNRHIADMKLPDDPAGLYAPVRYSLDAGGKRIRPVLALAACEAFGAPCSAAVHQALAIEMFHNFTLLHDDLMDHSPMRRGRPTVYVKWNERTAILSGDAMLTIAGALMRGGEAVKKLDGIRLEALLHLYDKTAMEVYEGQQYDMEFETRNNVSVDEYMEMIRLKTSVLIGCACQTGALMAGASDKEQSAMYAYGEKLGLAFQLQDDYLDTYGNAETFGKPIGGDIMNEKKTWLLISALQSDTDGRVASALAIESSPGDKIDAVRREYNRLELPDKCRELINRYSGDAVNALPRETLSPEAMDFFSSLAMAARTRDK